MSKNFLITGAARGIGVFSNVAIEVRLRPARSRALTAALAKGSSRVYAR